MSEHADPELPPAWDVYDLPPIGEMRNVSHDDDVVPTPEGRLRVYFRTDEGSVLMRSLLECRFSVGFDNEPGEPEGFVFQAPASMWPDEDAPDASLSTLMTEDEIPIAEGDWDETDERVFKPTDEVAWDFEIILETTPYEGET